MDLLKDWRSAYNTWMTSRDPRVRAWPLLESPVPTVVLCLAYIAFVTVGPTVLKGRSWTLRTPVLVYNVFIVVLNAFIAYELFATTWHSYDYSCTPVDKSVNPTSMRIAFALYLFYVSKLLEFGDSIFFVLRGKNNQLSFLHVYHHASMFFLWWIGVNFVPGGNSVFPALQNSAIHVVMYGYYFVAALGPAYKKYLGWKKYLTLTQIIQFWVNLAWAMRYFTYDECDFPRWMAYVLVLYMWSFIILFGNFYVINYLRKKPKVEEKKVD